MSGDLHASHGDETVRALVGNHENEQARSSHSKRALNIFPEHAIVLQLLDRT
jgi:hypothetical protein